MQILIGDTRSKALIAECQRLGWGRMFAEQHPTPWQGEKWGFDNGAFHAWLHERPFPADRFLQRLDVAMRRGERPYLAVCPDLVARGADSLEFSLGWIERVPREWPWYLAVQDGMDPKDVERALPNFQGLLLGGTTRFKSTAATWRALAHRYGLRFHYARASTPTRIEHAAVVGADSLDSSFPLWTTARFREFVAELSQPRSELLPLIRAWMETANMYEGDVLTGCTP